MNTIKEENKNIRTMKKDIQRFMGGGNVVDVQEEAKSLESKQRIKEIVAEKPIETKKPAEIKKTEEKKDREKAPDFEKEKEDIKKKKREIKDRLKEFSEQKYPLISQRNSFLAEIEKLKTGFQEITAREKNIEDLQRSIEQRELIAKTPAERKGIEKERWVVEEKRRVIEQKRWPWDEQLKEIDSKLRAVDEKLTELEESELFLNKKQEELLEKEKHLDLKINKIKLGEELDKIEEVKKYLNREKIKKEEETGGLKNQLKSVYQREEDIERKKNAIEKEEMEAQDADKKRNFEKQRWEIEEQRRKAETERWNLDDLKNEAESKIKEINGKINLAVVKEKSILEKIAEIENELSGKPEREIPEIKEPEPEIKKEEIKKTEEISEKTASLEQAKARIELFKKQKIETSEPASQIEPIGREKRREELLGRLHSPLDSQRPKEEFFEPPDKEFVELVKDLPKKPSKNEKLLIRILIVGFVIIILTAILTFWYWYFKVKNQYLETENQVSEATEVSSEPEIKIPDSLLEVNDTEIIKIADSEELKILLDQEIKETFLESSFKRIVIQKENKPVGFKEFSGILVLSWPEDFYAKADDGFTLFIYSQPQGNRLGLVLKITDPAGLEEMMKRQEAMMENDLDSIFKLLGKTKPAVIPYFRSASNTAGYSGTDFRYKTIDKNDLGICYALTGQYFIFSSSWASMEAALSKLYE